MKSSVFDHSDDFVRGTTPNLEPASDRVPPAKYFRANEAFTTATRGVDARSSGEIARPAITGMPIVCG